MKKTGGKKNTAHKNALVLDEHVWPVERNVLFRPDRMKYVRKLIPYKGCVFCTAGKKKHFDTLCVYQSKNSAVVLNKFPYNSGHVLVIPKTHVDDISKLSKAEYTDLMETLKKATQAVQQAYGPAGVNIGINMGAVAGAGIPEHIHIHIIPRWAGDLNFFPLIAESKVVIETLEQSYKRLITYFK